MKFETLIKFLMDWQGCTREQATHYIGLRDLGHPHHAALWMAVWKRTDDLTPGIWNVTVEEKSSLG